MKIFRNKSTTLHFWEFSHWLEKHSVNVFKKQIGISWKEGKRRKLRSYKVTWDIWECDCCGRITSIELTKGGKTFKMNNHFGPSSMEMISL